MDFDYASDLDHRYLTTWHLFALTRGPICWRLTLQSTVDLSIVEAEYIAVTETFKEAIQFLALLVNLGVFQ